MRYIKLGYGCELKKVGDVLFLYDLINSKIYKIFDGKKVNICLKIFSGSVLSEKDIYSEFGDDWVSLKKDLESNNLIIYSENRSNFRDEWDFGTKCMLSKDYMSCKPVINTAYINISNLCHMNCSFCEQLSNFGCVTCRKRNLCDAVNAKYFPDLISKLKIYGLRNIYFCGADPLSDIDLIKKYVTDTCESINVCIISNGMSLYKNVDFVSYMASRNIKFMLQIISDDLEYSQKMYSVMENLRAHKINFSVMIKSKPDSGMLSFLNANKVLHDYIKLIDKDYVVGEEYFSRPVDLQTNTVFYNNNLCLYSKIFVEPNGDVKNCFHMDAVGNLDKDSFGFIVNKLSSNWSESGIENKNCVACDLRKNCTVCTYVRKKNENRRDFCYIKS